MNRPSSSRPPAHIREDLSRTRLHEIFETVGWTVEDLAKDYGEDQLVRIFDNGEPSGLSFFVQVKSATSLDRFRIESGQLISYPFSVKKLRQWSATSLPVALVLWEARIDRLFWGLLDRDRWRGEPGKGTRRVHFDAAQVLDPEATGELRSLVDEESRALEMERAGAAALLGLLSESLGGASIEYEPGGVIIQNLPDGGALMTLFGEMLPILEEAAEVSGLTPEEAMRAALRWAAEPENLPWVLAEARRQRRL